MKIEFTLTAIKLGDDSLPSRIKNHERKDLGELSLSSKYDENDPYGLKSPTGYVHISCSGTVARSFTIGEKFLLAFEA